MENKLRVYMIGALVNIVSLSVIVKLTEACDVMTLLLICVFSQPCERNRQKA